MHLYLKCIVKGGMQNTNYKIINQQKKQHMYVMCSIWKRTFTLAPLAPLTMFSPNNPFFNPL